jgi:hypothetical protein
MTVTTKIDEHLDKFRELEGPSPTPEEGVLDAILMSAIGHDTLLQYLEDRMFRQINGPHKGESRSMYTDDDVVNDYRYQVVDLCARLAPIALKHMPPRIFAAALADSGAIQSLSDADLEEFMRPIFKEAGLGDRFEVRDGHEVYGVA